MPAREMTVTEALAELLDQERADRTGKTMDFLEWALRVPEPKSGTIDLNRFPYQRELYSAVGADAEEVVVKKATQVGVSTYGLRWVMFHADVRQRNSLYLFPTRQQMYDFADARIKASILASDYLQGRIPPGYVNNKGLKRIGLGYLYCRGSESPNELQGVDADCLFMDEYDDIRAENIPDAERRISGPDSAGLIRRVGVPQYPGTGLDLHYERSDQRSWVVKCPRCGHRQPVTYEANVDEERVAIVCNGQGTRTKKQRNCRAPLDLLDGEWVAKYPDRSKIGFWIPRLIVANADLQDIIDARHSTSPTATKVHYNKDLGLAYAPEEGRLSDEAIRRAQRRELPLDYMNPAVVRWNAPTRKGPRTMGVDVASSRALNVVIREYANGLALPLYLGECETFRDVAKLIDAYDVNFACVDHLPDGRLGRALGEAFPGRVWTVSYGPDSQLDYIKPSEEDRHVSVKRTTLLDDLFDEFRHQRRLLPGENLEGLPQGYAAQLQAPIRVVETDEFDRTTVRYENHGAADYAHAEAYEYTAKRVMDWLAMVQQAVKGDEVALDDIYDIERTALDVGTRSTERVTEGEYDPGDFGGGDYDPGF